MKLLSWFRPKTQPIDNTDWQDIATIAHLKVQLAEKDKEIAHLKTRLELADALINRERKIAK